MRGIRGGVKIEDKVSQGCRLHHGYLYPYTRVLVVDESGPRATFVKKFESVLQMKHDVNENFMNNQAVAEILGHAPFGW